MHSSIRALRGLRNKDTHVHRARSISTLVILHAKRLEELFSPFAHDMLKLHCHIGGILKDVGEKGGGNWIS